MSQSDLDQPLVPSILDRLIDERPDQRREAAMRQSLRLDEVKRAVRRDLQNLLNTRQRSAPLPADLSELSDSIVNYGVPDVTTAHLQSESRRIAFLRDLADTVMAFEPRLRAVRLTPMENADAFDTAFRFRMEAELHVQSTVEPVTFDSKMDAGTGEIVIRGESGGP